MINQAIHYIEPGASRAACGRGLLTVARTNEHSEVTCKRCLHELNAPVYVGTNRGRKQYELTCKGGPWDGKRVVLGEQVSGPMSMWIHVGDHVGRYNMNTGVWTPKETTE